MIRKMQRWAAVSLLPLVLASCSTAETKKLTPKQIAEVNKPATVTIQAIHSGEIAVPEYRIDNDKVAQFIPRLRRQYQMGEIASQEQAVVKLVEEIFANPLKYMQPTQKIIRQKATVTSQGTGFIVSEDGYVVTNAHVVSNEGDGLKQELAETSLKEIVTNNCQKVWQDLEPIQESVGETIGTREFFQLCSKGSVEYFAKYMQVNNINTQVYTSIGEVAPSDDPSKNGYLSAVKKVGEPAPGKDVAILKIEAKNLPTIALGDDAPLEMGDAMFVLGYPAFSSIDGEKALEPSLTSGLLSARQVTPGGWEAMQTNAAMNPGNSGGPVFDQQAKVIGIATFGSIDPRTGSAAQGVNFAIPISVVNEFLKEVNVEPAEGKLSQQYRQGIQQFEAGYYSKAITTFRNIQDVNPKFPYVQEYLSDARSALDEKGDRALPVWVYGAAGGVLVLVGAGGVLIWKRRDRRRTSTQVRLMPSRDFVEK
jgi:serine protease Do